MGIEQDLTHKLGPLPAYGWAAIASAGVLGFVYFRRSRGSSTATTGTDAVTASGDNTAAGDAAMGADSDSSGDSATIAGAVSAALQPSLDALTDNNNALSQLVSSSMNNASAQQAAPQSEGLTAASTPSPVVSSPMVEQYEASQYVAPVQQYIAPNVAVPAGSTYHAPVAADASPSYTTPATATKPATSTFEYENAPVTVAVTKSGKLNLAGK